MIIGKLRAKSAITTAPDCSHILAIKPVQFSNCSLMIPDPRTAPTATASTPTTGIG